MATRTELPQHLDKELGELEIDGGEVRLTLMDGER